MSLDEIGSVLIVDDSHTDAMFMSEAIKDNRIVKNTKIVNDGDEVMSYLESCDELPSLILLDLHLPRKDGMEVLREIKGHPRLKRIPVIMTTLNESPDKIDEAYALGVNAYLVKPIGAKQLFNLMECLELFWFTVAKLPRV